MAGGASIALKAGGAAGAAVRTILIRRDDQQRSYLHGFTEQEALDRWHLKSVKNTREKT